MGRGEGNLCPHIDKVGHEYDEHANEEGIDDVADWHRDWLENVDIDEHDEQAQGAGVQRCLLPLRKVPRQRQL